MHTRASLEALVICWCDGAKRSRGALIVVAESPGSVLWKLFQAHHNEQIGSRSLNEFELIRQFFERPPADPAVQTGIGDDGAVLRPQPGLDLVMAADTLVEGVHFPPTLAAADVGYRSVAVNLSDIAAMGARPRWMTLSLVLDEANPAWLHGFSAGLFEAADEYGVSLIGGDTTSGQQKVISIQVSGEITPGKALCRSGAIPGDRLYVSGTIGDAAAGLEILRRDQPWSADTDYLRRRFGRPAARVSLGQALGGIASAAIDVSDGLYADISRLLDKSGVRGVIDVGRIPLSTELRSFSAGDALQRFALAGGDDYELCVSAEPALEKQVMSLAEELGVMMTCIGEVHPGHGLICNQNGEAMDYDDPGFIHFDGTPGRCR